MKRFLILLFSLFPLVAYPYAADQQVTGLTNLGAAPATDDETIVYDTSATTLKAITIANLFTTPTFTTSITIGSAGITEAELEILDGASLSTSDINIIDGISDSGST